MYSSNPFPSDLYSLWNRKTRDSKMSSKGEQEHVKNLYAPPLSAYSSDFPGGSLYQLEYTINTTTKSSPLFTNTPLTQLKHAQLAKIRNTGYATIRPIGIVQTMEEIELEKVYYSLDEQTMDPAVVAIENSSDAIVGANASTISIQQQIQQPEIDLDAQVFNADEIYTGTDDERDSLDELDVQHMHGQVGITMDDEGFMAAEVEYQEDHSLDSVPNTGILINSSNSGTSTTFNSNTNTGRTGTTNPTTTSGSLLPIDEQNENEYSEQDMIVD